MTDCDFALQVYHDRLPKSRVYALSLLGAQLRERTDCECVQLSSHDIKGQYTNINWCTPYDNRDIVWGWLREQISRLGLEDACIVACQGDNGWGDYLLLHHYDTDVDCEPLLSQ